MSASTLLSASRPGVERGPIRLSILHLLAPGAAGGAERVVRALASGQAGRGHTARVAAIVCCDRPSHHPFLRSLEDDGIEAVPVVVSDRAYARERALVRALVERLRPEIVHTHGYRPDVLHGGPSRRAGSATVTTAHGFTGAGWKSPLYERLQCRALRRFDAVVAVSRPLAALLAHRGVGTERLHVVPNAFDGRTAPLDRRAARDRLDLPETSFTIGWVGRMSREKGLDVLIDALPELVDVPFNVSVIGSGPEECRLHERAAALGVGDRIRWHGFTPDAEQLYAAFDVLVLSSRTEGTPIVLFEAMAAGVPIVATRVGGVPDVLRAPEALLVPPEEPAAIAAAIRRVHEHPREAAVRAEAARDRLMTDFRREPWVNRYDAVYRRVLR